MSTDETTEVSGDDDAPATMGADVTTLRHLGRYRIDGVLGSGGMGVVLAAHDPDLDRAIALKVLRSADAESQARLVSEAQAMARLRHPNVVAVHDVGVVRGRAFVAMELVTGPTLDAWLRTAPRPWRAIVARFAAAGRGLAAAHAAGIVHRDFKATNALVDHDDVVRVADFGLAGAANTADGEDGVVAGTPAYMAPEQHAAEPVGPAADQFAFAVALWEALAGARPFAGPGPDELQAQKRAGAITATTGPGPSWLYARLRRALAPAPADRYPSMAALVATLERGMGRRRRVIVGAAAIAALVGTAVTAIAVTTANAAGPRCELAASDVTRAWNPVARMQLAAAFATSRRPHARDTAERVAAALDRRAAALAEARVDACKATHARGVQSAELLDRRMACFDRRTSELAAVVAVLSHVPDDVTVDHATDAVAELAMRDDCSGDRVAPRPPEPLRPQVEALEARLAEAEAQYRLGHYGESATRFDALVVDARALGFPPLVANVEVGRAQAHTDAGHADVAAQAYQTAATAAATAGDDALIAECWLDQLELQARAGGQAAEALAKMSFADVAVTRAGSPRLAMAALHARGAMEYTLGKYADARTHLEAALALARANDDQSLAPTKSKQVLMSTLGGLGEDDAAIALGREVVAEYTAELGPQHPVTAGALDSLGNLLDSNAKYDDARLALLQALAIQSAADGDSPTLAFTLHHLAVNAMHLGLTDEAMVAFRRSLAIRERVLGPDHPLVAGTLFSMAGLLAEADKLDLAVAGLERALAIYQRTNGPDAPQVAQVLDRIATMRTNQGRFADALAAAQRSVEIRERAFGPKDYRVGQSLVRVSFAYEGLQRMDLACQARAKAVPIIEAARGSDSPDLLGALTGHADCELAAGRLASARAAAEQIVAIVAKVGARPFAAGPAHFVLARVYWANPATRAKARAEAALAHAAYANAPAGVEDNIAELAAWDKAHPR